LQFPLVAEMHVMIGWRLRQASAIPASGRRQTLRRQTSQYTHVAHFMGFTRGIIARHVANKAIRAALFVMLQAPSR